MTDVMNPVQVGLLEFPNAELASEWAMLVPQGDCSVMVAGEIFTIEVEDANA